MLCLDDIATEGIVPDGGHVMLAAAESTKWLYASMVLKWQNIKNKDAKALKRRKPFVFALPFPFIIINDVTI